MLHAHNRSMHSLLHTHARHGEGVKNPWRPSRKSGITQTLCKNCKFVRKTFYYKGIHVTYHNDNMIPL